MREVNLDILIENFLSEIVVDLNDNCLYCKKKREKIKKIMKFDILNQIIIFSIQRIDPFASIKNNTFIKYDEIISLKKFKDEPSLEDKVNYKLFATIHHNGNLNSGHYYSLINIENKWFEFNDSNVEVTEDINFNSSNVCVLFYRKYD